MPFHAKQSRSAFSVSAVHSTHGSDGILVDVHLVQLGEYPDVGVIPAAELSPDVYVSRPSP